MNPWLLLLLAGGCEVGFAACMGRATQLSWPQSAGWWLGFALFLACSMVGLFKATTGSQALPLGIAYAVWTGIGALGTVLVSNLWLQQPLNAWQWFFVVLLVGSVAGLKWASGNG